MAVISEDLHVYVEVEILSYTTWHYLWDGNTQFLEVVKSNDNAKAVRVHY